MDYVEMILRVPPQTLEAVTHVLQEHGSGGVVIDDEGAARVRAYFAADETLEERLRNLRGALARLSVFFPGLAAGGAAGETGDEAVWWYEEERLVSDEDWANAWKAYWKPLRIGERLVVVPSWEEYRQAAGDVVVRLDPGMAFGTGTHASTALALRLLEREMMPGMAVLDVGTGSGILAIAAALLGAGSVVALDIDPVAVRVARENTAKNRVADRVEVIHGEAASRPDASADLVVANITADVLMAIAGDLVRVLRPGGTLILSGILLQEARRVAEAFDRPGVARRHALEQDGWTALVLDRLP